MINIIRVFEDRVVIKLMICSSLYVLTLSFYLIIFIVLFTVIHYIRVNAGSLVNVRSDVVPLAVYLSKLIGDQ